MQGNKHALKRRWILFMGIFLLYMSEANAQLDSVILKNGSIIMGVLKSMDKGVATVGTPFGKSDFSIKWAGVKEVYSKGIFMTTLTDGRKMNGFIQSIPGTDKVVITAADSQKIEAPLIDVVYLKGVKTDFWSRLKASVDAGFSLSKANDLKQVTVNSSISYTADKWMLDFYYTMLTSSQENVEETKRIDGGLTYRYSLKKDWFLAASVNFLSNTEQALKLRSIGKVGVGNYLVHTNSSYWAASLGLSFNNESFTNGNESRNSLEAYLGTEVNLFDIGDLSLFSSLYVYPSLTENGRWRTDFKIDGRYNLPYNFYLKTGLTLNYDNRPATKGNETDYVLFFTLGWQL